LLAVITILITGCATSPVKKLETIAAEAPDAAAYLIDELKAKKIIFINETHTIVNEELFLAEHLQEFYDAGVRYFFSEGDITKESYLPIYPWMPTGNRVERRALIQAVASLEQSTAGTDPFKVVLPELGRNQNDDPANMTAWLNYRDEYAAKNIIETLDNAPAEAKAICLFGGAHGVKTVTKETQDDGTTIDRIPLGYLLSERYGSDFISLNFIAESRPKFEDAWKRSISGSKIISPEEAKAIKDIVYYGSYLFSHNYYDAFIANRETYFGTPSNYVPSDDQLRFWVQNLKEFELNDPKWADVPQIEKDGVYLIIVYYLKLYYGDHFNYTLWKSPGGEGSPALLQALEALESYAFNESVKPSAMIRFHHSLEDMRLYGEYMYYSLLTEVLEYGRDIKDIVKTGNIQYIIKARELFPEDLWTLYWLAFIKTETGAYAEGLAHFQELFAADLSLCMSILPLAYKKAARCAGALGNTSLSAEYAALSESLYNELGIDPSQGPFSIEAGYGHHVK
jgi:hypothetical protein